MNLFRNLILSITCLALSACGFHLRGQVQLPQDMQPVYINPKSISNDIVVELRNVLRTAGITLTSDATKANLVVNLFDDDNERRTLAVGSGTRAAEYQLFESVHYEVRAKQGKTLIGPRRLVEQRVLANNPNEVVSTDSERQLLRQEMRQRLAQKIAGQLRDFDYQNARQSAAESDETTP